MTDDLLIVFSLPCNYCDIFSTERYLQSKIANFSPFVRICGNGEKTQFNYKCGLFPKKINRCDIFTILKLCVHGSSK